MNLTHDLGHDIAQLPTLTVTQLRQRYADLFGEITRVGNKQWLVKRIAWRWQAQAEGDLSERARERALHLANDADLRLNPPKVLPELPAPRARSFSSRTQSHRPPTAAAGLQNDPAL